MRPLTISFLVICVAAPSRAQTCFEADAAIPLPAYEPVRTVLADHDGDGDFDLATQMHDVGNLAYFYVFHRNEGGGAWAHSGTIDTGVGVVHHGLADVDGDGDADPIDAGHRHDQAWFRNAASFCTPATFNLTNALRMTWRP